MTRENHLSKTAAHATAGVNYAASEATVADLELATAVVWADELDRRGETQRAIIERNDDRRRRSLPVWAHHLPPTRKGGDRRVRLELCGVALPFRDEHGRIAWDRRGCRDRACPVCSARRSRRIAADLRKVAADADGVVLFVTLTQPRRPHEEPIDAVDRLLSGAWRQFMRRMRRKGNIIAGGYRAVETTARLGKGLHAHLHCLFELKRSASQPGVDDEALGELIVEQWLQVAAGTLRKAQDVRVADDDCIYQCAKYPEDTSGLLDIAEEAPHYCRRVLEALVGRRTGEAFGTWRERLRKVRDEQDEESGSKFYADATLHSIARGVPWVTWAGGGRTDAATILSGLCQWPGERREEDGVTRPVGPRPDPSPAQLPLAMVQAQVVPRSRRRRSRRSV